MSGFNYTVFYGGGSGPDVWDAEKVIGAVDIFDALSQARELIEDNGGWIFSVDQCDYPEDSTKVKLQKAEAELADAKGRLEQLQLTADTYRVECHKAVAQIAAERDELKARMEESEKERSEAVDKLCATETQLARVNRVYADLLNDIRKL